MKDRLYFLLGILIGIFSCVLGVYLYLTMFSEFNFTEGYANLKSLGQAGKVITLGALLNLVSFFVFYKLKRDMIAKGIIMGTIIITFYTIFL